MSLTQSTRWRTVFVGAVLLAATLLAGTPLTAQTGGTVIQTQGPQEFSLTALGQRIPLFFESYPVPAPRYPVQLWSVEFASVDFDGSPVTIRAQLFVPTLAKAESLPVYVFASGTTGIGDLNAPSLEVPEVRRWGWYRENMLSYASQGFIVMFPDYTGFHDPARAQRYFSKLAEGFMMLDAIRAVYRFFSQAPGQSGAARPSQTVFTAGYSQGGHAAMAAADLRAEYAPEVPLTGVITYGSTNDVAALLKEGVAYGPLILYSYREMYPQANLKIGDYLLPRWLPTFDQDAGTMGVDVFQTHYGFVGEKVYTPKFLTALKTGTLAREFPTLADLTRQNHTGLGGHRLPALVIQGDKDFIVTTATQTRFVDQLRQKGSEVQLIVYPEASHRYTRHAGFQASVEWMRSFAIRN